MARPLRIEYAGAVYHVMARGNRGNAVFRDDRDRLRFLETLGEACEKTGWQVHAYVLMGNHYHLLAQTPEGNLVAGMKWLQGAYTQRFNSRHKVFGHLFQGRYKAVVVEGQSPAYFEVVATYIHLNPARAGIIRVGEEPLGREDFLERLKGGLGAVVAGKKRESHSGGARRAHGEAGAQELLAGGLAALGLRPSELEQMPKGAPEKTVLAWWLRARTTVPLCWIGERLGMGHYTRVTQAVSRMSRKPGKRLAELKQRLLTTEKTA